MDLVIDKAYESKVIVKYRQPYFRGYYQIIVMLTTSVKALTTCRSLQPSNPKF